MKTVITVKSSGNALDRICEMLKAPDRILEPLASMAAEEAASKFASAQYDGANDVRVGYEVSDNEAVVTASGSSVMFIEFGTGIYYNGWESYPGERPAGVAGIGQYGKGHGKQETWTYSGDPGTDGVLKASKSGRTYVRTHGNPPAAAMYYGAQLAKDNIKNVIMEAIK